LSKYVDASDRTNVHNVPVFRLPEMYLIIAESQNELGQTGPAATALLNTAKRDPAIESVSDLPSDQPGIRDFIRKERIRELMGEGHRLWDMRRTGELLTKHSTVFAISAATQFNDYDVSKFAFPIPLGETNASKITQNQWSQNLPF
jgi:hypothetical protein